VPLSCNLGALTSWNPLGHSRPVTGLLYLYHYHIQIKKETLDVEIIIFDAIKSNVNGEDNSLNVDVVQ